MAPLDRNPLNTNLASPLKFMFNIKRAPSLSYFCQTWTIPTATINPAAINTPSISVPYVGDHLTYEPVNLTFKVDQLFENWQEIYNWMAGDSDPDGTGDVYTQLENNPPASPYRLYSDVTLIQLDSQNNPLLFWTLENAFPVRLTGPSFNATDTEVTYMTSEVTFKYVKFKIDRTFN